jgi:hypothetical protein
MMYRTWQKIKYRITSGHKGGHGIHSPFLFSLISRVIENKGKFSAYTLLTSAEVNVRNMLRILDMKFYYPESLAESGFSLKEFKKLHLLPANFDRLLFRPVNEFSPRGINFYGSTFGVTLLALALADKRILVNATITNDHYLSFCRRLAEVYEINNISLTGKEIAEVSDFVVVQNPLNPSYCDRLLSEIFQPDGYEGLIVLCGIHTTAEIEAVWYKYQKIATVRISLDLFEAGIFICRKDLQKEDFVLRF